MGLLQHEQALLQARHHQRVDVGAAEARRPRGQRGAWRHLEAGGEGDAPPASEAWVGLLVGRVLGVHEDGRKAPCPRVKVLVPACRGTRGGREALQARRTLVCSSIGSRPEPAYVHHAAKSTPHACSERGTLPTACARSSPRGTLGAPRACAAALSCWVCAEIAAMSSTWR